jgi:hypothetical protein
VWVLFGLVLGGLRVALLPLSIVIVVLTGSLAVLLAISTLTTVSVFAVNVVTLFGVGLAVDYGLLPPLLRRHAHHIRPINPPGPTTDASPPSPTGSRSSSTLPSIASTTWRGGRTERRPL